MLLACTQKTVSWETAAGVVPFRQTDNGKKERQVKFKAGIAGGTKKNEATDNGLRQARCRRGARNLKE